MALQASSLFGMFVCLKIHWLRAVTAKQTMETQKDCGASHLELALRPNLANVETLVSGSRVSKQMICEIVHGWQLRSEPDTLPRLLTAHHPHSSYLLHHSVSHGDSRLSVPSFLP